MSPSLRRIGLALGAAGALAFAATGCGGSADQAASAATQQQGSRQGARPGQRGPDLSALATKLGVSESKLQAAMQSAPPTQGSSPQDMAANLAKALGLTESKVQAAMEATRPSGAGQPPQAPAAQGQTS